MAEFTAAATLDVSVDDGQLRQVRREIESGIGDVSVGVEAGGARTRQPRDPQSGQFRQQRGIESRLAELGDLAVERNDILEDIRDRAGGGGGGGAGTGTTLLAGQGARSVLGGGLLGTGASILGGAAGAVGAAGLLAGGATIGGLAAVGPTTAEPSRGDAITGPGTTFPGMGQDAFDRMEFSPTTVAPFLEELSRSGPPEMNVDVPVGRTSFEQAAAFNVGAATGRTGAAADPFRAEDLRRERDRAREGRGSLFTPQQGAQITVTNNVDIGQTASDVRQLVDQKLRELERELERQFGGGQSSARTVPGLENF